MTRVATWMAVALASCSVAFLAGCGGDGEVPVMARSECPKVRSDLGLERTGPCMLIDMDPGTPGVQGRLDVDHPQTFAVDVVIEDPPQAVGPFQFSILYDDSVLVAREASDPEKRSPALNANPDVNEGVLGPGLDCNPLDLAPPWGDKRPATGAGEGEAYLGCIHVGGEFELLATGVLATVTFRTLQSPSDSSPLDLSWVVVGDLRGGEMGTCEPAVNAPMPCVGGSVR